MPEAQETAIKDDNIMVDLDTTGNLLMSNLKMLKKKKKNRKLKLNKNRLKKKKKMNAKSIVTVSKNVLTD